jgi:predicted  nucleic acid-binding Zn-ribbon protein
MSAERDLKIAEAVRDAIHEYNGVDVSAINLAAIIATIPPESVSVPEEWREAVYLAAQMLTWGRDEGITNQQDAQVLAHQKMLFSMLAAAPNHSEDKLGMVGLPKYIMEVFLAHAHEHFMCQQCGAMAWVERESAIIECPSCGTYNPEYANEETNTPVATQVELSAQSRDKALQTIAQEAEQPARALTDEEILHIFETTEAEGKSKDNLSFEVFDDDAVAIARAIEDRLKETRSASQCDVTKL